jgi:hypothetical protein
MRKFDPLLPFKIVPMNGRKARESGLSAERVGRAGTDLCGSELRMRLIDPLPTLPVIGTGAGSQKAARRRCQAQRATTDRSENPIEIATTASDIVGACRSLLLVCLPLPSSFSPTHPVQAWRKSAQVLQPASCKLRVRLTLSDYRQLLTSMKFVL